MKEKLSLLDVCKLPDVLLHSKKALFNSITGKQSSDTQSMKEQIISLSYTVKTIGLQGEEVGISSRRIPLKLKKQSQYPTPTFKVDQSHIPRQSFYSRSLVPVKQFKEGPTDDPSTLQVRSSRKTIHIENDHNFQNQQFKIRAISMAHMRTHRYHQKEKEQNFEDLGKIEGSKRVSSAGKKKSFSCMLKECTSKKQNESINPLMHQENPLFKKIKRIKSVYPEICKKQSQENRFKRPQSKFSSSSNLLRHYRQKI